MALPLAVDFETFNDEDAIGTTAGNGDSFDGGFDGTNQTVEADTDIAPPDETYSRSIRWTVGATPGVSNRHWDASLGLVDDVYTTFAFYRDDTITTNLIFAQMQGNGGTGTCSQLRYNTTNNTISIRRQFTVWDTTTETLSEDTWYYLQWHVHYAASSQGTSELRLYDADQTLLETINNSSGTGDFGGQIGRLAFGAVASPTASTVFRYSGFEASGSAYPALPTLPSAGGFTGWGVPIL